MRPCRRDRQNRRRPTRNLAVVVGVVLLIATAMSVASAATTTERWTAKLGSTGQYGSVTLTRTVNNGYSRYDISASVKHFRAKTTYTVTNASGTCSVPGGPVTSPLIQNLRTNAAGSASVSYFMSYEKGNVLIEAMNAGNVIVRVGTRCGYLRGPAAVVLPSPTPTQRTQFSPGPGVPVLAGRDEMVVTAAEQWSDPHVPGGARHDPGHGERRLPFEPAGAVSPRVVRPPGHARAPIMPPWIRVVPDGSPLPYPRPCPPT